MATTTTLGLLTRASMSSADRGRRFFEILQLAAPDLAPRKYGSAEPFEHAFDAGRMEKALALWNGPRFFWKTMARGGDGAFLEGTSRNSLDVLTLSVERDDLAAADWLDVLKLLSTEFQAEFAYVHATFDDEIQERERYKTRVMPLCQGLSAPEFERKLPGLAWAMYFGEGFAERIGIERLLAAPAYAVRRLGERGVFLQVTASLRTFTSDYQTFREASDRLIEYLGEGIVA
jgi:hypothetical protein